MKPRITIKEIAKQAEVSIGTVDRVLHDRGRVSEETKERVLQIAKEGNYSSNVYARNLKLNKTYHLAVILPEQNPYWIKHRQGVEKAVGEHDFLQVTLHDYSLEEDSPVRIEQLVREVLAQEPDGIVLAPIFLGQDSAVIQLLHESQVPVVLVDSKIQLPNCISRIGQDAYQSGRMSAGLLHEGYTEDYALYVTTFHKADLHNQTIMARIQGLKDFLTEVENGPDVIMINLEKDGLSLADAVDHMKASDKPVRVFVPNSRAYLLARSLGLVQQQLKLRMVGYDLIEENKNYLMKGTINYLIHQQPKQQGFRAIQTLHQHLLLNMEVDPEQRLPLDIITKENLMYCEH
ncbi:hypothetical protein BFP72_01810 [Reichenbachiella sp. 5M10]|uniref:LacI family DNA-binding transcriptional regulator n=1 Tax=Reichenbachiella sp. 5M10 TaxID=1889772 RepID=UPI000C514DE9|nr:LacI family DNA-binding transcriptional regulator [Reichenbachiella sp. 5M10]PIB34254.1 hypothetical protein BFP72_01810 [Reichenbachiella sp. 5M10]